MPEDNRQQRRGGSRLRRGWRIALFLVLWPLLTAQAQQIRIPRIELMPNQPRPYAMRDWKRVAVQYDSLVFDVNRVGKYLPLIWKIPNPINYPEHESFGMPAVVGPRELPLLMPWDGWFAASRHGCVQSFELRQRGKKTLPGHALQPDI